MEKDKIYWENETGTHITVRGNPQSKQQISSQRAIGFSLDTKSLYWSQVTHSTRVYSSFNGMKWLRVSLLLPGWDGSPSQGYSQHFIGLPSQLSTIHQVEKGTSTEDVLLAIKQNGQIYIIVRLCYLWIIRYRREERGWRWTALPQSLSRTLLTNSTIQMTFWQSTAKFKIMKKTNLFTITSHFTWHIQKILQYKIQTKGRSRTHDWNA